MPYGIDPRHTAELGEGGLFTIPKDFIQTSAGCVIGINVLYYRDAEGYSDDWYDALDMDESF